MDSLAHKIDQLLSRFESVGRALARPLENEDYIRLSKEYAELMPVAQIAGDVRTAESEYADLRDLIDESSDSELCTLAQEELSVMEAHLKDLRHQLHLCLLPKDAGDEKNAIVELRAGTGGEEAALFVGDLARMYQRYGEFKGWQWDILSHSGSERGGYKEIILRISGKGVFSRLKFESGVHRVQRVPETESQGRVHTSAASVAVLPEAEEIDIMINPEDIRIDTMRSSGAGGQHVNTTDSAVRITHIPTGIVVTQSEKSQHQNRARAMTILRARLFETERQRKESERSSSRRSQIGSGDRSERIRTYNFPQGRVTDHRIGLTLYKLPNILQGESLDEIIDGLITHHQAEMLAGGDMTGKEDGL